MAGPAGRVDAAPAGPGAPRPRRRLGEVLVDAGVLSAKSLEEALAAQAADQGQRRKLGEVIVALGLADETQIAQALSDQLKLPFVNLERLLTVPDETARLLSRQVAIRHQAVPLSKEDGVLTVAMGDPTNVLAIDDLRMLTRAWSVRAAVATMSDLREAVAKHYGTPDGASHVLESIGDFDDVEMGETRVSAPGDDEDGVEADSAPVVRLVNAILGEALHNRASDIHIEPGPRDVRVRMRIDGSCARPRSSPSTSRAR